jgi:hypothetical protein
MFCEVIEVVFLSLEKREDIKDSFMVFVPPLLGYESSSIEMRDSTYFVK